jgi:hypothetical protein
MELMFLEVRFARVKRWFEDWNSLDGKRSALSVQRSAYPWPATSYDIGPSSHAKGETYCKSKQERHLAER